MKSILGVRATCGSGLSTEMVAGDPFGLRPSWRGSLKQGCSSLEMKRVLLWVRVPGAVSRELSALEAKLYLLVRGGRILVRALQRGVR